MKGTILKIAGSLFFVLCIIECSKSYSQVISIIPNHIDTFNVAPFSVVNLEPDFYVTSGCPSDCPLAYVCKIVDGQPAGWSYSVCGFGTCQALHLAALPFTDYSSWNYLDTNQYYWFLLDVSPNGIIGCGTVELSIFNPSDSANTVTTAIYNICTTGATLSTRELTRQTDELVLFPNPVADNLTVNFSLNQPANVSLNIYDAVGKQISMVESVSKSAGNHTLNLNLSKMNVTRAGVYFIEIKSDDKIFIKRFVVL